MLARVDSFLLQGIDAINCEVETDVAAVGLNKTTIVGLAEKAVKESIERVRVSMINGGYAFPAHGLLINLAPADVRKDAPALDLPIAIGLLRASKFIAGEKHRDYLIAGELALDGRLRKIRGSLSMAMLAKSRKLKGVLVPAENAREAAVVDGVDVIAVRSLSQAVAFLNDALDLPPYQSDDEASAAVPSEGVLDFADVRGQEAVKRAVTIAAAGGHNLAMIGPPGTGKTMLAHRMAGILPPLSRSESLETTRVYSSLGLLPEGVSLMTQRPVRTPHHSATAQALVGGGTIPRPGEVSLAHHGILFLDELPEFGRHVLETLRQPLEAGEVTVARASGSIKFPARFMLVAAMNPTASGAKSSDPRARDKYLAKLSGPLLDRIDLHIEVPAVGYGELTSNRVGTNSQTMRQRVMAARKRQLDRFGNSQPNAVMGPAALKRHAELTGPALLLMKQAMDELGLSARAFDKVRRVARTIADLEAADRIAEAHVAEAIQYRLLDRRH